jgi:hypothetical protein
MLLIPLMMLIPLMLPPLLPPMLLEDSCHRRTCRTSAALSVAADADDAADAKYAIPLKCR